MIMRRTTAKTRRARRPTADERFDSKLVRMPNGCIEWAGSRTSRGYGQFSPTRVINIRAHRYAWARVHGTIPSGLNVCHRCDNRACVNTAHLFLGTHADNMRDMTAKNRQAYGERNGQSKLTAAQALAIRQRISAGEKKRTLAREYGVDGKLIHMISNGMKWARALELAGDAFDRDGVAV